ncbi:Ribosomal protein S18 acetylase RimI [Actinokineospora alba]|uniref:Ribosomal protein S18 acetylase RimI n=1 Tax=Actinokineospora alba TaxID=504798 RepID=A0A1H0VWX2_9PSEU|nr:GNAT family N-acetyltransferase [Actinokineospora alba]TDP67146.1 ribosomal protein S18 acetylase RimI-like enzyme [Actinokineospora alba]SDJ45771.1 Ribosomal protein S18 acetylase RimI [Actinokineospora alba]SDP82853.1 Ribosomal protein S18 acetylase RimI [Actinokineospora alba]
METTAALRRIAAFEDRFARVQATEIVELGWGHVLLQHDYPASWHHNRVIVTGAVEPATVIATADKVLGDNGHRHRLVNFTDGPQGAAAAAAFEAAGYEAERIVTMIHSGDLPARVRGPVEALSFDELRSSLLEDWKADYPDDSDESNAQLADRVRLYSLGADVTFLGVRDASGEVVAHGELYVSDGLAQFENIITRPEHRGKGYAKGMVIEALHRARDAGCDLSFLTAEATNWPRAWYRRIGYRDAVEVHHFQRTP